MHAHNNELESTRNSSEKLQKGIPSPSDGVKRGLGIRQHTAVNLGIYQTCGGLPCVTLGIHQTLVFMKVAKVFIESIHEVYHGIHGPEKARRRKVYMVKYHTNTHENLMNTSETGPFYNKKFLDENQQNHLKPSKKLMNTFV